MKRGLKVDNLDTLFLETLSYNRFPDEKGTESIKMMSRYGCRSLLQPFPR